MIEANEQYKLLKAETKWKDSLISAYSGGMHWNDSLVQVQQTAQKLQALELTRLYEITAGKEKYIALQQQEIKAYKKALHRSKIKTILTGFSALAVAIGISLLP